jgi:ATP:corrinoid adenosyltransferase
MKGQVYGELRALQDFPLIAIEQFGGNKCIRREEVTDRDRQRAEQGLQRCLEVMQSGNFNIIVLMKSSWRSGLVSCRWRRFCIWWTANLRRSN